MNYKYSDWIYRKYKMEDKITDDFFQQTGRVLVNDCKKMGITCNSVI
jgi:hypothetical protein